MNFIILLTFLCFPCFAVVVDAEHVDPDEYSEEEMTEEELAEEEEMTNEELENEGPLISEKISNQNCDCETVSEFEVPETVPVVVIPEERVAPPALPETIVPQVVNPPVYPQFETGNYQFKNYGPAPTPGPSEEAEVSE